MRYLLFSFQDGVQLGGMRDYTNCFVDIGLAVRYCRMYYKQEYEYQLLDTETKQTYLYDKYTEKFEIVNWLNY